MTGTKKKAVQTNDNRSGGFERPNGPLAELLALTATTFPVVRRGPA